MTYKVEKLTESLELGEGPHWDQDTESLYFVDIFGKSIHKYKPSTKFYSKAVVGDKTVSFIIPVAGQPDKFVISTGNQLVSVDWDGISDSVSNLDVLAELPSTKENEARFNDAKVDSSGRLWAGVFYPNEEGAFHHGRGNLHTLNPDRRTVTRQLGNITITNGLAWNDALKKFYYIDSEAGEVYQFDYDAKNGTISNQEVVFNFEKTGVPGKPDGMAIDADGNLWVACFNGYRVVNIDPRKPNTLLQTIDIPAKQVTSVAFGGRNLDEIYVTSGQTGAFSFSPFPEGPEHGAVYKVTGLGVKGLLPYKVKL